MPGTILITGSNGQIGKCISIIATKYNFDNIIACTHNDLDITDPVSVEAIIEREKPSFVINTAAYTAVDKAENNYDHAYSTNVLGPRNLALSCHRHNATLVHISTDYIFDGYKKEPYLESDQAYPINVYGKTKLFGEKEALKLCPQSIILRTSWVFSEHGSNFVKKMLQLMKTRDTLSIVSDQYGAPTYADDISNCILKICTSLSENKNFSNWGIYNYTGYPYTDWCSFAQKIYAKGLQQKLITKNMTIHAIGTKDYPTPAKRPKNSCLCCTKIYQEFDISPSDWEKALDNLSPYMNN